MNLLDFLNSKRARETTFMRDLLNKEFYGLQQECSSLYAHEWYMHSDERATHFRKVWGDYDEEMREYDYPSACSKHLEVVQFNMFFPFKKLF